MSALARRAREGLRAAYLQAHLAEDNGAESCSSVLSKLGAYTAGGVQGAEQRRIRKHLQTCARCNALHSELAEVCSTLRAHAGMLGVPVAATALVGAQVASVAVAGKAALLGGRIKFVLAGVASAAAVGLFSLLAGLFTNAPGPGLIRADQDAPHGLQLIITTSATTTSSVPSGALVAMPPSTEQPRNQEVAAPPPPPNRVGGWSPTATTDQKSGAGTDDAPAGSGDAVTEGTGASEATWTSHESNVVRVTSETPTTTTESTKSLNSSSSTSPSSGSPTPTTVIIRPTAVPSYPGGPTYLSSYRPT